MSTNPHALGVIARLGAWGILTPSDIPSLQTQTGKVLDLMSDMCWHQASEIRFKAGGSEGLRRLRELRNLKGYDVEMQRRGMSRDFWYRLVKI